MLSEARKPVEVMMSEISTSGELSMVFSESLFKIEHLGIEELDF